MALLKLRPGLARIKRYLARALVQQGLDFGWPMLVALGWRLGMSPRRNTKTSKFGRTKLVVLSKSGGVEDVEVAYSNQAASYAVLFLPREIVKQSGRFFLEERVSDTNYHLTDRALEEAKQRYRAHLSQVLFWFQRIFGLSAIVQFNIAYWAERELAAACLGLGVRFVGVHKESNCSPGEISHRVKFFSDAIGQFEGDAVAVYNEVTKQILTSAGVVEPRRVHSLGSARLDESHRLRHHAVQPEAKTVLFYLMETKVGLPRLKDNETGDWLRGALLPDGSIGDWSEMVKEVNKAVMELASSHPEIRFVCKGKTGFGDGQIQALVEASPGPNLPDNVHPITGGIGHKLLGSATVCIGFNSTAVLEAMAAGVPVIVPNIFSRREKHLAGYTHDVSGGALVPTSPAKLQSMVLEVVERGIRHTELTSGQKIALDRMMGNSDGKSGERLRQFLDNAVFGELNPLASKGAANGRLM